MKKLKSCAANFWARPEIIGLTSLEQLTYLKLLTTSSLYDLHGLTFVQPLKKLHNKRKGSYLLDIKAVESLAKKGFIIYDPLNSIAFVPGSTSDEEAQINLHSELRSVQKILHRFTPISRAAQMWVMSWFLSNMSTAKISIVQDFLDYGQPWTTMLLRDVDQSIQIDKTNDFQLTGLISTAPYKEEVWLGHVTKMIVREQRCNYVVKQEFIDILIGENINKRLELYLKKRNTYLDSVLHELMTQFESLYLEKRGVSYEKQSKDQSRLAYMIFEHGKDLTRERMNTYFELSTDHSIVDFKNNFNTITDKKQDLSIYWDILNKHMENTNEGRDT